MSIIHFLYKRITGRSWYTVGGHVTRDYGPTPGSEVEAVFGCVPDGLLLVYGPQLLAEARRIRKHTNHTHQVKAVRR